MPRNPSVKAAHCRFCSTPKWPGDACSNPDCTRKAHFKSKFLVRSNDVIGVKQHGFHELASRMGS